MRSDGDRGVLPHLYGMRAELFETCEMAIRADAHASEQEYLQRRQSQRSAQERREAVDTRELCQRNSQPFAHEYGVLCLGIAGNPSLGQQPPCQFA